MRHIEKFYYVGIVAIIIGAVLLDRHLNEPNEAINILKENGFNNVIITGSYLWCGKGTRIHQEFEATNNINEHVSGTICAKRLLLSDKITTKKIAK